MWEFQVINEPAQRGLNCHIYSRRLALTSFVAVATRQPLPSVVMGKKN